MLRLVWAVAGRRYPSALAFRMGILPGRVASEPCGGWIALPVHRHRALPVGDLSDRTARQGRGQLGVVWTSGERRWSPVRGALCLGKPMAEKEPLTVE